MSAKHKSAMEIDPLPTEGERVPKTVEEFYATHGLQFVPQRSKPLLPTGYAERKKLPIASGVLDYFTAALIAVAEVSRAGNEQHNPGEPIHWSRGKSTDQADTMMRHFMERGTLDEDGLRHSAKMVWRALALLQLELEAAGAPLARGARIDSPEPPM